MVEVRSFADRGDHRSGCERPDTRHGGQTARSWLCARHFGKFAIERCHALINLLTLASNFNDELADTTFWKSASFSEKPINGSLEGSASLGYRCTALEKDRP